MPPMPKPDFHAVIADAKRKLEERRRAAKQKQKKSAGVSEEERIDAGVRWLKAVLRPLLAEAAAALAGEKIELAIEESFDVHGTEHLPDILFQCLGAPGTGRGGLSARAHSDKYWIRCDGESCQVGAGGDLASEPQRLAPKVALSDKSVADGLNDAICACIESYYDDLGGA
jgi:hypothetical protein